jgi:CheY-like chemotaxis protein
MIVELASREDSSVPPATIILAEDNDMLRRYFVDVLEIAGYEVLPARDGLEAFALLRDRPDASALVTDIEMPRMDGFTLARRARECFGEVDVLYVSGSAAGEFARRGVSRSSFLPKPCTPSALRDAVLALLGKAALVA